MQTTFKAPDIECDGCANSIRRALGNVQGVSEVAVDVDAKTVQVTHEGSATTQVVADALDRAGFPAAQV